MRLARCPCVTPRGALQVVEVLVDRPATAGAAAKTGKLTLKTTDMETVTAGSRGGGRE